MLSHADLAELALRSYEGPQSGIVAGDVRYDLVPRAGELVVVIPGTRPTYVADLLRDASAWPRWLSGVGFVHSGFGSGAEAAWRRLARDLPARGLITYTGHSSGGVMAQILAAIHASRWPSDEMRLVTFGAPRVAFLNPHFGRLLRVCEQAVGYQRRGDIVPDLPWRPYHHPMTPWLIGRPGGNWITAHSIVRYRDDLVAMGV